MPLPVGGETEAWPPPEMKRVLADMAKWAAWYSSDPDALSRVYGGDTGASTGQVTNHPSQFRGGLVGAVARMWWGQPTPAGQPRSKLHVPLAADIAAKSADLLYSEPPTFTCEGTAAQERLERAIDEGLYATLLENADASAGLSGGYLRVVWDQDLRPGEAWIDAVHADCAVPEWKWGQLVAVTFWQVTNRSDKDEVTRHLMRYERGQILHAVYQGDDATLGERLATHPVLDALVTANSTEAAPVEIEAGVVTIKLGVEVLAAEYVPNIRPARLWRREPAAAGMGRSDYAGVEGLLDQLDEAWSSWMQDLRLGKARIMVPPEYLRSLGPGQGATWSADQEVFMQLKMMPSNDGRPQIESQQFAIRVAEHEGTVRSLMQQIIQSAGYSGQSFGLSGDVAITATEVSARERQSYITRDRKIVYQRPPVTRIIEALLAIEKALFNAAAEPERPRMDFADGVSDSTETTARTLQMLEAARAISVQRKVEMLNPGGDPNEIKKEVARILAEQNIGRVEDPGTFTGGPPPGDDEDPLAEDPEDDLPDAEPEDGPPPPKA